VREQHAEGDVATTDVRFAAGVGKKFWDRSGDGRVEFEQAALVEKHGCGRGGNGLRDGSEVEESCCSNGGGTWFVSEVSESFERDELILSRYGDGGGRESTSRDCLFQNGEGGGKHFVLMVESGDKHLDGRWSY
jgi:hypothetical protein